MLQFCHEQTFSLSKDCPRFAHDHRFHDNRRTQTDELATRNRHVFKLGLSFVAHVSYGGVEYYPCARTCHEENFTFCSTRTYYPPLRLSRLECIYQRTTLCLTSRWNTFMFFELHYLS